jgi:hypothetical protein
MTARSASNAVILDRTLRRLRRAGRLDDVSEVLAVLAGTSARLVDDTCTPDSGTPGYAQAACLRVHVAVLSALSGRIAPLRPEDDPWERIARQLEGTIPPADAEAAQAAIEGWAAAEQTLAAPGA